MILNRALFQRKESGGEKLLGIHAMTIGFPQILLSDTFMVIFILGEWRLVGKIGGGTASEKFQLCKKIHIFLYKNSTL